MVLSATSAEAHTVISVRGPFFGGIKHFFLSPDDVLAAVAFGMLVGLREPSGRGGVLVALPAAWLAAGIVAVLSGATPVVSEVFSACTILALGLLVAANRELPSVAVAVIGVLSGGLHGYFNGAAMHEDGPESALLQLTGVGMSVLVVVFYLFAVLDLADLAKRPWVRIIGRVLGSWIAASGLLLLGWSLRVGR